MCQSSRWLLSVVVVVAFPAAEGRADEPVAAAEWHVAPDGDDANPGTKDRPFATLERARTAAREQERSGDDYATIRLAPGIHRRTKPFLLDSRDSRLVLSGPADRSARIHAGRPIDRTMMRPVGEGPMFERLDPAARGHVVAVDLGPLGMKDVARPADFYQDGGGLPEVYSGDEPMPLARWPNDGPATMERVLDKGKWDGPAAGRRGGSFVAREDRLARWNVAEGVWLEGYWRVPWDPATIRAAAIDAAARRIDLAAAINGGIGSKYAPKGELGDGKEPWWAVNLVEEIDREGEWCVHHSTKTLYVWPPASGADLFIARMDEPVVRIENATLVALQNLVIEGGLGDGVAIEGGRKAVVAGCTLRNLGGNGVVVRGGRDHAVKSCDVFALGDAGIRLAGGNRAKLEPCGHAATNNDVHHVGRRRKTYAAAIQVGEFRREDMPAVGCRVAHNLLHDLPHAAVLYTGNDNVLELNEVCRVALTSADVGAFYTSFDWTSRGNVIRHNFVHDCPRANAFYLDDGDSGDTVEANVVVRAAAGPFVGGGHDNVIRHNIVVDCPVAYHVDARGVDRGYQTNATLRKWLESVHPDRAPWKDRYPALAALLDPATDAARPRGVIVTGNVAVRCDKPLRTSAKPGGLDGCTLADNLDLAAGTGGNDPKFAAPADLDYTLGEASPIFRKIPDFPKIPFATIGLKRDAYRRTLPARSADATTPAEKAADADASQRDIEASNDAAAGAR